MFNLVEEFPSPRASHVLKLGAVSTLLVLLAVAGFVMLNPLPRQPDGEVLDVKLYAPRVPVSGTDAQVQAISATDSAGPLLVLTPVRLRNASAAPLSIFDLNAVLRLGDAEYNSAAVSPVDFEGVFHAFPDLASYQQPPILRHAVIPPGQILEGLLIFHYPLSETQWDQRTSFQVRASFDHGPEIVLAGTDTAESAPRLDAQAQ